MWVSIPMLVLALIPIALLFLAAVAITASALLAGRVPSGAAYARVSGGRERERAVPVTAASARCLLQNVLPQSVK